MVLIRTTSAKSSIATWPSPAPSHRTSIFSLQAKQTLLYFTGIGLHKLSASNHPSFIISKKQRNGIGWCSAEVWTMFKVWHFFVWPPLLTSSWLQKWRRERERKKKSESQWLQWSVPVAWTNKIHAKPSCMMKTIFPVSRKHNWWNTLVHPSLIFLYVSHGKDGNITTSNLFLRFFLMNFFVLKNNPHK